MRASGATPSAFARSADITTSADAPSFTPGALPAVTEPSVLNAGFSAASDGRRVGANALVFVDHDGVACAGPPEGGHYRDGEDLVAEQSVGRRLRGFLMAERGVRVLRLARDVHRSATTSPALPMCTFSNAHQRPSTIIESRISALPIRRPSRTRGMRYGQLLIDSMPPATATSMSPARESPGRPASRPSVPIRRPC